MKIVKAVLFEFSAMIAAFLLVFYGFFFLKTSFAYAAEPTLIAVDGDTVKSSTTVYRLQHYDTPEIGHAKCSDEKQLGLQAKGIMITLLATNPYHIVSTGKREKYGRTLATLYINGQSTADIFIGKGLAVPYEGRGPKKDWCSK